MPKSLWRYLPICACAAAFVVLVLLDINRYGLDGDESTSRWMATLPLASMFEYLRMQDKVFAFYYSVLHFWSLGGSSAPYLRGLSVLFGAASLAVVYRIATMLCGRGAALWSMALLGTSFLFILDAVRARAEIMMFFFSALAALFAVDIVEKKSSARTRWLFALCCIAAIFSHPAAVAWVIALLASLVAFSSDKKGLARRMAMPAAAVIVFGIVPLAAVTALDRFGAQIGWIGPLTAAKLAMSLSYFSGGGSVIAGVLLAAAAAAAFLWSAAPQRGNLQLLLFWLVCSLCIVLLISLKRDIIQPYYYLYCWIPVSILCGAGLEALGTSRLRYASAAILAAFVLLNAYELENNPWRHEDFRAAAAVLHGNVRPADAILVHAAYYTRAVDYAMQERGDGAYVAQIIYPRSGFTAFRADPPPALARYVAGRYAGVWLVLSHEHLGDWPVMRQLIARYPHRSVRAFEGVSVMHVWR